jgi:hypothetical protein
LRVEGSELRVEGSGFRVKGPGSRVQSSGFRVQGSGLRVQDVWGGGGDLAVGDLVEILSPGEREQPHGTDCDGCLLSRVPPRGDPRLIPSQN